MNIEKYFEESGEVRAQALAENLWLKYLVEPDNIYVNAERVDSIVNISGRETIEYVMRMLDIHNEGSMRSIPIRRGRMVSLTFKVSIMR